MEWIVQLGEWSVRVVDWLGYPGIVFLMTLESSVFPVPSELVMPQAGYLVGMGKMNMFIVIVCGVVGSWFGALLNYFVAKHVGRPFFLRFGKYFHSYNCRNQVRSLFSIGVFSNTKLVGATLVSMTLNGLAIYCPFFQKVLKTQPLTWPELFLVIAVASTPFWAMEIYKRIPRKQGPAIPPS